MNTQPHEDNVHLDSQVSRSALQSVVQRLLLACGIVAPILFTATYSIEGALHPGYDLLRQPISNLELVTNGWVQSANFIIFGLLIVCFAFGLRKELVGGFGATWIPLLQGLVALGLIISGVFVHDPLHTSGNILSFSALVVSCFVFARRFAMDTRWHGWATYSIATGVFTLLFIIAFGVAQSHHGPAGLFERMAIITRSIWTILLAARLLAKPGRLSPQEGRLGPQRK